eukprot:Amastigsp_a174397_96.p2 type:complete len:125 gc:universal Amastigsp_a174397_96:233-607(+)
MHDRPRNAARSTALTARAKASPPVSTRPRRRCSRTLSALSRDACDSRGWQRHVAPSVANIQASLPDKVRQGPSRSSEARRVEPRGLHSGQSRLLSCPAMAPSRRRACRSLEPSTAGVVSAAVRH